MLTPRMWNNVNIPNNLKMSLKSVEWCEALITLGGCSKDPIYRIFTYEQISYVSHAQLFLYQILFYKIVKEWIEILLNFT